MDRILNVRVYAQAGYSEVFSISRVDDEVNKRSNTVPCPEPKKLGWKRFTINTNKAEPT